MNTISNVVSFHQFSKSQENVSWKDFVCVCGTIRSQHEFFLSPVVMKWSDEIWIFDLRNLRSYWENISKNKNILWKDMISSLIEKYFSSFEVVSFADHPWKSLLLARELQDRKMKGFFSDQHEFGMHVLATLRDQVWFSCVEDVLGFFSLQKEKKSLYRKQVQQFQLFLQRVKSSVSELPSIDSSAMERRFGYLIGKVWGWSFSTQEDQDIKSFPWRNFSFQKKPRVHRTLDHFMDQWSWIKERLIEDFDHLCQNPILTRFCKVVCLQWNLEFEKYGSIKKKIRFKNPFGLHEQSPGYDVFLFQMEVAFGQIKNQLSLQEANVEIDESFEILSWSISVEEFLYDVQSFQDDFFESYAQKTYRDIVSLHHQCHAPIRKYKLVKSFEPEKAYQDVFLSYQKAMSQTQKDIDLWKYSSVSRPLFVFSDPQPMKGCQSFVSLQMLEKVSSSWWYGNEVEREYYKMLSFDHNLYWVYKNQKEQWFKHGIFS